MNIFYLDHDPGQAATWLTDTHTVSQTKESGQLIATTARILNFHSEARYLPDRLPAVSHHNHPCAKWLRESHGNWIWLLHHAAALSKEYTARYGRIHAYNQLILYAVRWELHFSQAIMTPPPMVMPEQYQIVGDPLASYRNYYAAEKAAKGWHRNPARRPHWLT